MLKEFWSNKDYWVMRPGERETDQGKSCYFEISHETYGDMIRLYVAGNPQIVMQELANWIMHSNPGEYETLGGDTISYIDKRFDRLD